MLFLTLYSLYTVSRQNAGKNSPYKVTDTSHRASMAPISAAAAAWPSPCRGDAIDVMASKSPCETGAGPTGRRVPDREPTSRFQDVVAERRRPQVGPRARIIMVRRAANNMSSDREEARSVLLLKGIGPVVNGGPKLVQRAEQEQATRGAAWRGGAHHRHAARSWPRNLASRPYESLSPLLGIKPGTYRV